MNHYVKKGRRDCYLLWRSQQLLRSLDKTQQVVHDKLSETGNEDACLFFSVPSTELPLEMQSLRVACELNMKGVGNKKWKVKGRRGTVAGSAPTYPGRYPFR